MHGPILIVAAFALAACSRNPVRHPQADPQFADEIAAIRAFDNHTHAVSLDPKDQEYDALPVEGLEPQTMWLRIRPEMKEAQRAHEAVFGSVGKDEAKKRHGDKYLEWILDRAGIETAVANRVGMGPGLNAPRFLWVSYADALLFPLDNSGMARDPDKKAFYALEEKLLKRYIGESGGELPADLETYVERIVRGTLRRHKDGRAIGVKFEAAYLRSLQFDKVDKADAAAVFRKYRSGGVPPSAEYKKLQDYLFREIAAQCGTLGMAVHIHTSLGAGGYFDTEGGRPQKLESVLNDPGLRKTIFVLLHGGYPYDDEIAELISKPNVYTDTSAWTFLVYPSHLADALRKWIEIGPDKVLFGSDAYPFTPELGFEEMLYSGTLVARQAVAIALTRMMRDGDISHAQALQIARGIMHDNAARLYRINQ
jgi:predicted TIM-barrel fold metal-dependent hydrolase